MVNIKTALKIFAKSRTEFCYSIFCKLNMYGVFNWMPDALFLKMFYRLTYGESLNLDYPQTFSQKLQWLKLFNRNPQYTLLVDKYAVKDYVANLIGDEFIIPTLGIWDKPEDIDWDLLPNQFVLKTTHGGGNTGVLICRDKTSFDKKQAISKLQDSLKFDIYRLWREWPYRNVPKRILAEEYINPYSDLKDIPDYKFFCFNGEPVYCQVIRDRNSKETIDFYDMNWTHMPFVGLNPIANNGVDSVSKPVHLDKMIDVCRVLSKSIPFVRVDLYVIKEIIYFGEITFFPASGFGQFKPSKYDSILGSLIKLPSK